MSDKTEHLITDLGSFDRSIVETGILDSDGRAVRERLRQPQVASPVVARAGGEKGENAE